MRPETAIQFEQIFNDYSDPRKREERRLKKRREEMNKIKKEDTGLGTF